MSWNEPTRRAAIAGVLRDVLPPMQVTAIALPVRWSVTYVRQHRRNAALRAYGDDLAAVLDATK
ncbi:hypothetical protein [Streptomyces sp. NPDC020362]|uniref:hypothetical protein n=1 Tax=unclassified Streptomyces TaxID=2593676 RepID=UPI000AF9701B